MNTRRRAWLDLVRLPNAITAPADVLAGFLFAGGIANHSLEVALACLASVLLYMGGVALNDYCDVEIDATERPERPIPSGRITKRAALRVIVAFLAIGIALAALARPAAGIAATLLVTAVIMYDAILKRTPFAPLLMGTCRGLNFLMGVLVVGGVVGWAWWPAGLIWLYITSVTFFARKETEAGHRPRLALGFAGVMTAVLGLLLLNLLRDPTMQVSFFFVVIFAVIVARPGWRAVRSAEPQNVQRAIKVWILSLILFDACIAASARGWIAGLAIAALLPLALLAARAYRVT